MRVNHIGKVVSGLAAAAALGLAGCTSGGAPAPPRTSSASTTPGTAPVRPSLSAPSPQTTPGTYNPVNKPCDIIFFGPLESILGPAAGDLIPQKSNTVGIATFMSCTRRLGPATDAATVMVQIETLGTGTTQPQYQGLRKAQLRQTSLTDIAGLGQGAYTRIDPDTGPHLVVYDGNLYLEITVLSVPASVPDAALLPAMTQTTRHTLTALKR